MDRARDGRLGDEQEDAELREAAVVDLDLAAARELRLSLLREPLERVVAGARVVADEQPVGQRTSKSSARDSALSLPTSTDDDSATWKICLTILQTHAMDCICLAFSRPRGRVKHTEMV